MSHRGRPDVVAGEERVRYSDRPPDLERPPRAPAVEPALKLVEPSHDAAVLVRAKGVGCKVGADLGPDRFAEIAHLAAPVEVVHELLRAERDEHADRDDRQVPHYRVPAVRRRHFQRLNICGDPHPFRQVYRLWTGRGMKPSSSSRT